MYMDIYIYIYISILTALVIFVMRNAKVFAGYNCQAHCK